MFGCTGKQEQKQKDVGVYLLRLESRVDNSMLALQPGSPAVKEKGVSIAKLGVGKHRLPGKFL